MGQMRRSGKFYRNNEAEVMAMLGLSPTKGSGSGWVEKEDGQSEQVICQLKSTDANSIRIHKQDLDTLAYNGAVAHKLPVFAIQYLCSNEVYLVVKPEVLPLVAEYIETGEARVNGVESVLDLDGTEALPVSDRSVKSSATAREEFAEQCRYKRKTKSAL